MILYHGSYLEICKPDLVHSRRNVDFGQAEHKAWYSCEIRICKVQRPA